MVYLYDGSLDGFFTCIYKHYYDAPCSGIQALGNNQLACFESYEYVEMDSVLADKVHDAIKDKFTESMYQSMYHAFLSREPEKDMHLLYYIELGFKIGRKLERLHTHEDVYQVMKMSSRVGSEQHRFLGLLRFSDMGSFLYAVFEPENNLLPLLGDHFADRLSTENWVIHDLGRRTACVGSKGQWLLTDLEERLDSKGTGSSEEAFRSLWKAYFNTIGIEGRENRKLQQQFVPLKYRQHLLEFK